MKKMISPLAVLTSALYFLTFYTLVASSIVSCQRNDLPAPTPNGWNNTTFQTVNDEQPDDCQLIASLCDGQPQNLMVSVWYFDPRIDPATALTSIANPGIDDDGDPIDPEQPDDTFEVKTLFKDANGKPASHYSSGGFFTIFLDANQLAVLEISDEHGHTLYKTIDTTPDHTDTCFSF